MKKLSLLLALCLFVLAAFLWLFLFRNKDKKDSEIIDIDIRDTGFEYNVDICDKYFELVECIIDNDPNQAWDLHMKLELKSNFKNLQKEWRQLSEDDLIKKCTDELANFENLLKENNADSFGCLAKN